MAVKLAESEPRRVADREVLDRCSRAPATFAKPIGGPADFVLPLEFSAKGAKAMVWDEDKSLRAVVGGQLAKLDACAKKAKVPGAPTTW